MEQRSSHIQHSQRCCRTTASVGSEQPAAAQRPGHSVGADRRWRHIHHHGVHSVSDVVLGSWSALYNPNSVMCVCSYMSVYSDVTHSLRCYSGVCCDDQTYLNVDTVSDVSEQVDVELIGQQTPLRCFFFFLWPLTQTSVHTSDRCTCVNLRRWPPYLLTFRGGGHQCGSGTKQRSRSSTEWTNRSGWSDQDGRVLPRTAGFRCVCSLTLQDFYDYFYRRSTLIWPPGDLTGRGPQTQTQTLLVPSLITCYCYLRMVQCRSGM